MIHKEDSVCVGVLFTLCPNLSSLRVTRTSKKALLPFFYFHGDLTIVMNTIGVIEELVFNSDINKIAITGVLLSGVLKNHLVL